MTSATSSLVSDDELVVRAANGDDDAFEVLFRNHRRTVLAVISRTVGGSKGGYVGIDDLLQEVFLKAYQNLSAFTGGSVCSWLCRIAANAAIDRVHRSSSRRRETSLDSPPGDQKNNREPIAPEPSPEKELIGIEITKCLAGLDPREREIILDKFADGLSHREIANRLGVNENTAKVCIDKAIRHVKKRLIEQGFGL